MGNAREFIKNIAGTISPAYRTACRVEKRLDEMEEKIRAMFAKQDMMAFWQMHRPGEPLSETKLRFFRSIPKAEGALRKVQLGSNALLKALKRLCDENGLQYWLFFGTLLGAARHQGAIPWDDDIDVGMLRADFDRLCALLQNDAAYEIVPFYHTVGRWYVYKFMFRQCYEWFWVDISVWDYADSRILGWDETGRRTRAAKDAALAEVDKAAQKFAKRYESEPLGNADDAVLQAIFRRHRAQEPRPAEPDCIYPGMDSVCLGDWLLLRLEDVFPLDKLEYEGVMHTVPCGYLRYLAGEYDWLDLPYSVTPGHMLNYERQDAHIEARLRELGLTELC